MSKTVIARSEATKQSTWRECKLGDVCINIAYGYTASANSERIGPKFVRITDIVPARINWDTVPFCQIDESKKEQYRLEIGDIVIARTGATTGYNKVIRDNVDAVFASYLIRYKINSKIANPSYVAYNLQSYEWKGFVEGIIGGSAQPGANAKQFASFNFLLPPLEEQKAIAEVLSSLDDKIDLLHRQNKTLEELAQTLFRQWFIEEAKDEWEEYKVRDFATHKKVSIKPAQNPNDEFLHFSLPAFDTNKEPNIELGSDIKSNKYQVEPFSILMSKLNPKTPRVWDIYFEPKVNSICSTEFQVIQPNEKGLFPFISTLLKSDKVIGDLTMSASGTSGSHQGVKPEDILNINFLTPSVDKIREFSELLEPNYLKQMKNQNQIKTLENMRDTLLPKLMSGEVRVES
ncbi:restriction endonuclease subunit S [Sulfurimonas sp.]|uniref:restriction endonuclease subunit S n=1 Tax=Sulfurimonas sp. TaxID=2022749 RepID=UPI001A038525|nr:restriction endonuclease subunit S [Sulfurimonas sp.]MBE0513416.1 restriction endonuclease subunit S [Sulfurimonas sp.]